MSDTPLEGIEAIVEIGELGREAFVPPLSDYLNPSQNWHKAEYRCFETIAPAKTFVGYWKGDPGEVSFDSWPYDEICSIIEGEVGVRDTDGRVRRFSAGAGFIVPRGWRGTCITFTPARKIFVAVS